MSTASMAMWAYRNTYSPALIANLHAWIANYEAKCIARAVHNLRMISLDVQ